MMYREIAARLPAPLRRYLLSFEWQTADQVRAFAASLAAGTRVLDAGAGEGQYRQLFLGQRYTGVDLGIGDKDWNYAGLDAIADLDELPFASGAFDAALSVVTLEHVREPARVLAELFRVLAPAGRFLVVVPQEWEIHQAPHDYYRYTRYGLRHLLEAAGFRIETLAPAGGLFRLLSRRLLNALQFFPGPALFLAAIFLVPPALILPLLDGLDRERRFTLGYICVARKP